MFSKRRRTHNTTEWLMWILALLIMGIILLIPLMKLLLDTVRYFHIEVLKTLFSWRHLTLFIKTLVFSSSSVLLAGAAGYLSALYIWQSKVKKWRFAKGFLWSLVFVPAYVHGFVWIKAIVWINRGFRYLGVGAISGSGLGISIIVQTFAWIPLCFSISWLILLGVERSYIEAASIVQGEKVLQHILLPLTLPHYRMALLMIWVITLFDYTIPSLFSFNVYAMELFLDFSSNYIPARAVILSMPLIILSMIAIQWMVFNQSQWKMHWNGGEPYDIPNLKLSTPASWIIQKVFYIVMGVNLFFALVLLSSILKTSVLRITLAGIAGDLITTIQIWTGVLLVSLMINLGVSFALKEKLIMKPLIWALLIIPFVIPAPVIGIALINIWNQAMFQSVYQSLWMPVMGLSARFWSIGALITYGYIMQWNKRPIEMAQICEKSSFRNMVHIKLPMASKGIFLGLMVVGMLSFHEIGATILLLPPGKSTTTLRIYNYLHYGASDEVAIICFGLSIGIACMTIACIRILQSCSRGI